MGGGSHRRQRGKSHVRSPADVSLRPNERPRYLRSSDFRASSKGFQELIPPESGLLVTTRFAEEVAPHDLTEYGPSGAFCLPIGVFVPRVEGPGVDRRRSPGSSKTRVVVAGS